MLRCRKATASGGPEHTLQNILFDGQRVRPKDRIAQLLQLLANLVVHARIVVVRPSWKLHLQVEATAAEHQRRLATAVFGRRLSS